MSLYVALAWNGIQFVLRKGDNSYKKCQKRIIVSRKHLNKSYIYIYIKTKSIQGLSVVVIVW